MMRSPESEPERQPIREQVIPYHDQVRDHYEKQVALMEIKGKMCPRLLNGIH